MNSGITSRAGSRHGRLRNGRMSALASLLCLILLIPGSSAWGRVRGFGGGGQRPQAARPAAPARPAFRQNRPAPRGGMRPAPGHPGMGPGTGRPLEMRPGGQQHLPQWLAQHQNMTPREQENLLRREPGFNRLSPDQQQRVLNRLRSLDSRPPAVRERMAERNEAFERLSPEGKQDVRAAAQAFRQMPAGRQVQMRRAFNNLRQLPPDQRQAILNSARFTHTFTPQERHVLGSLLSIEPYEDGH